MSEVQIKALPNGPYLVKGDIKLVDPTGNEVPVGDRKSIALCRCGGSATKPFCDGTHSRIGFQAAEPAVIQRG